MNWGRASTHLDGKELTDNLTGRPQKYPGGEKSKERGDFVYFAFANTTLLS